MKKFKLYFLKFCTLENIGQLLFTLGIFFTCSSLFISILFLIPSLIIGTVLQSKEKNYFKNKFNISFFICAILIIFSTLVQNFILQNDYEDIWDAKLSIIGMANWIPFFWVFWSSKIYLNSIRKREKFGLILITGTFPLIFSGFTQYFLNWTGPYEILNGLIIWFQKPLENPGGLSGLFSNQNYAGSWLNLVLPFSIALSLNKSNNLLKKSIEILFLLCIVIFIFLTYSRNAWAGLILSITLFTTQQGLFLLLILITIFSSILIFSIMPIFNGDLQSFIRNIIPERILLEFAKEGYENLDVSRLQIFGSALKLIKLSPFIGIGAASFSYIFKLETGYYKGHSHNLISELAVSYGLPVTIIIFSTLIILFSLSAYKLFFKVSENNEKIYFEKAFWISPFIFFISQLVDIQYFDGKISIVVWLLLAGLNNIIEEKNILIKKY